MTAAVGPDRVRAACNIHRHASVVADEATSELDVRIGRLRENPGLASVSVSRAAESVVQTHRRQVDIDHSRRWIARIARIAAEVVERLSSVSRPCQYDLVFAYIGRLVALVCYIDGSVRRNRR
jgi:hypothetical protein